MIGCDGNNCKFKWFHLSCQRLVVYPYVEKWYCLELGSISDQLEATKGELESSREKLKLADVKIATMEDELGQQTV